MTNPNSMFTPGRSALGWEFTDADCQRMAVATRAASSFMKRYGIASSLRPPRKKAQPDDP